MDTLKHLHMAALINLAILPTLFLYMNQIKKLLNKSVFLGGSK